MLKKLQQRQVGFTLVEVIVVLVVLAILIAFLIPALTAWIDRAREKSVVAECREVVLSAQGTATEAYAKASPLGSDAMMRSPYLPQIYTLSEVKGTISAIAIDPRAQVLRVEYTSKSGILVVYDSAQNPAYQFVASNSGFASAVTSSSTRLLDQLRANPGWGTGALSGRDKQTQALQDALLAQFSGTYPALTDEYRKMLTDKGLSSDAAEKLNWRPILSATGELLLAGSSSETAKRNPLSVLIYYNGSFYYHTGWAGNGVTESSVSDQTFNLADLKSTPSNPPKSEWIRVS